MRTFSKKGLRGFLLLLLLSLTIAITGACGGGSGGGDSGNNNQTPPPNTNATITGTVAGTTVKAFDLSGNEIASSTATGNPKTFTLNVPAGGSYKFYLIENEGTASERVYALYVGATNVFNISSAVTVDLGFVDTSTGNAVPQNNPLNVSGVSSGGANATIPPSLASSAFSLADLQGTWNFHVLISGDASSGWSGVGWGHGAFTIDNAGFMHFTFYTRSNGNTNLPSDGTLSITSSGIVSIAGATAFHGVISQDKNMIVGTDTDHGGSDYILFIAQKAGAVFIPTDLEGTWNYHLLKSGDGANTNGWQYGAVTINGGGNVTHLSVTRSNGVSTLPSTSIASITSSGVVSDTGYSDFHGVMSNDKRMVVGTMTDGGGYDLIIFQKVDISVTFSQADLEGTWNFFHLWAGDPPGDNNGWSGGTMVVDGIGNGIGYCAAESDSDGCGDGAPIYRTFSIDSAGVVSQSGGTGNSHIVMTQDKSMLIGVNDGSYNTQAGTAYWYGMLIGIK